MTTTAKKTETWKTPTVPYTLTDAVNRAAAATGSLRGAAASHGADYNGKRVLVDTGARAGWRAHYMWAGINWLTRGSSFESALQVALRTPASKARGGQVEVRFSEFAKRDDHLPTDERREVLRLAGLLPAEEADAADAAWRDWRFDLVHEALDWDRRFGAGAVALLLSMDPESQAPADYRRAKFELGR